MASFDRVVLIFNPKSTGNAQEKAQELRDELSVRAPELLVELVATQHAGHALDLAHNAAATGRPLVISVSGDGGYNEVVNGAMPAGNDNAAGAVLAAGNSNAHRRSTTHRPFALALLIPTTSVTTLPQPMLASTSSFSHHTTRQRPCLPPPPPVRPPRPFGAPLCPPLRLLRFVRPVLVFLRIGLVIVQFDGVDL